MKSETKSTPNRRSERPRRPYPSYIVQFDTPNRSRQVPALENQLECFKKYEKINNYEKSANLHDITLGLTAICTALEWSNKVSVFGFSFFQEGWDKQHYFESITPYHRGHDALSEKHFVESLEKNGRLKTY